MTARACVMVLLLCHPSVACGQCFAVFELTNTCPTALPEPESSTATIEFECVLRCTLSSECRLSVYLRDSAACYNLPEVTVSTGSCGSGMTVRRKLSAPIPQSSVPNESTTFSMLQSTSTNKQSSTPELPATTSEIPTTTQSVSPATASPGVSALSFASSVLLWYDFRKGFTNLADPSKFPASPFGSTTQNSANGVQLIGSSGSYLQIQTTNFYNNFKAGKSFSLFFQGNFATSSSLQCISSFSSCSSNSTVSYFNTNNIGGIHSKTYFADGSDKYAYVYSKEVFPNDNVPRSYSVGVSFDGEVTSYVDKWYTNGTLYGTESPNKIGGSPTAHQYFDCLRIGNCFGAGPAPYDGWLECWGFVNSTLSQSEFDSLRNLCNS